MKNTRNTPDDWIKTIKTEFLLIPIMGIIPALFIYCVDDRVALKAFVTGAVESATFFYYLLACFLLHLFFAWVYSRNILWIPPTVKNGLCLAGSIGVNVADGFVGVYRAITGVAFAYIALILALEPKALTWTYAIVYLLCCFLLLIATVMFARGAAWSSDVFKVRTPNTAFRENA